TLMGNLTRDPELRTTPNGAAVCSFSLALNRSYKNGEGNWTEVTDYVDVVAWGPLGERVAQYLTKGRPALVSGRLQSRSWEQDGQKRNKVEVVANDVTFLGGAGGGGGGQVNTDEPQDSQDSAPAPKKSAKKDEKEDVVIEDIGDEPINLDDIPF
ncbi:single-stranded DNA-binding protein, partial [Candidatus Saccharibacteria bacterium]|nr:single-stranded DNA-binding protein [Candidatus Saccharibacteria bacterium]